MDTGQAPGGPVVNRRVRFGSQGRLLAPFGVGTWAWGDRGYWGYGRDYDADDVAGAYRASRAAGIDLFDTAEVYGRGTSERLLGGLLRDDPDAAVATKFAPLPWRAGRRGPLRRALEASLTRLGQDRIDLYQIHFRLPLVSDGAWLADLAATVTDGLVGAVGVSNYGPSQLRHAHAVLARSGVPLASNQIEYSLLARKPERTGLLELCRELDIVPIAYSPLAQGLLTGKYRPGHPPRGFRGVRSRRRMAAATAVLPVLTAIGAEHGGRTPAQVALNWLIAKGTVPIPGAKTAEQATANAGALGWALSPDQVAELDQATEGRG